MKLNNFNDFVNEAKSNKIDYQKKFGKQVEEINTIIDQAKKDDIWAVETDSTWESKYKFENVELTKTQLKVYYEEYDGKSKNKVDTISLAKDSEMDFDEVKYMFSWIKKTIKKGYKEDGKTDEREKKAELKRDKELEKEEKKKSVKESSNISDVEKENPKLYPEGWKEMDGMFIGGEAQKRMADSFEKFKKENKE